MCKQVWCSINYKPDSNRLLSLSVLRRSSCFSQMQTSVSLRTTANKRGSDQERLIDSVEII